MRLGATRAQDFAGRALAKLRLRDSGVWSARDRLRELTDRKAYDEAVPLAGELLRRHPNDRALVRQVRGTFSKAGALTPLLDALVQERRIRDTPWLAQREAQIRGRLLETSPDFALRVPGGAQLSRPVSPPRVLHLLKVSAPYRQSGYTMRAKYTLEGQRAVGLEPVAMTYLGFPRSVGVADAPDDTVINGVRYMTLDVAPEYDLGKPYDELLQDFVAAAAPQVREVAPAVIHAHSGYRGYDLARIGIALGHHFSLPVVYEVRGFFESLWTSDHEWSERSETYRRRFQVEAECMRTADAVVTLSESMRSDIVARGIPAERVFVVPNGVDCDYFQPQARRQDLVDRFGLAGAFVFGYVSNLDHYREGHELLVDAALHLRRSGVEARALIIGDGDRRGHLERYVRAMGADDVVIFAGKVPHEEVRDYYALLDVFVIPRVAERAARLVTPLKPYEAMASGIPLVTSDLDALREVTGEGSRGRYFPSGNAESLGHVLADLASDEDGRSGMAERARTWVVENRQWKMNGNRYEAIYRRLR